MELERPQTPVGLKLAGGAVVVVVAWLALQWVLGIVSMLFNLLIVVALLAGAIYLYRLFTNRS